MSDTRKRKYEYAYVDAQGTFQHGFVDQDCQSNGGHETAAAYKTARHEHPAAGTQDMHPGFAHPTGPGPASMIPQAPIYAAAPVQFSAPPPLYHYPQYGAQSQYMPPPQYQYAPTYQGAPHSEHWDEAGWAHCINQLTDFDVRSILLFATQPAVPGASVQQAIASTYQRRIPQHSQQQQPQQQPQPLRQPPPPPKEPSPEQPPPPPRKTVDFSHHLAKLDAMWDKYSSNSGSKEYKNAFHAVDEIQSLVQTIGEATPDDATWGTKASALFTLYEIGEAVIDAPSSTLGSEVRKHFQSDTSIAELMVEILQSMEEDEISKAGRLSLGGHDFRHDIEQLISKAEAYAMEMDWESVLEMVPSDQDDDDGEQE